MPPLRKPWENHPRPPLTTLSVVPRADEVGRGKDHVWTGDYTRDQIIQIGSEDIQITSLASGTEGGRASVGILVRLPDDRLVFAETTLRLFQNAAMILASSHPDGR